MNEFLGSGCCFTARSSAEHTSGSLPLSRCFQEGGHEDMTHLKARAAPANSCALDCNRCVPGAGKQRPEAASQTGGAGKSSASVRGFVSSQAAQSWDPAQADCSYSTTGSHNCSSAQRWEFPKVKWVILPKRVRTPPTPQKVAGLPLQVSPIKWAA